MVDESVEWKRAIRQAFDADSGQFKSPLQDDGEKLQDVIDAIGGTDADKADLHDVKEVIQALQDDEEDLQDIINAIANLQEDDEKLQDVINAIEETIQTEYWLDFQVTNGSGGNNDILLTLTPEPDPGEMGEGVAFEVAVVDGDTAAEVAGKIADAINDSEDFWADIPEDSEWMTIWHYQGRSITVVFDDGDTGVTIDYHLVGPTQANLLREIMMNTEQIMMNSDPKPGWIFHETSGEDSSVDVTVAGEEGKILVITGIEVATRGSAVGNDMVIELKEDETAIFKTVIGDGAAQGTRISKTFQPGIELGDGEDAVLSVPSGGSGVVAEVNLVGFDRW